MYGKTYRNCVKAEEGKDHDQLDEEGLRDWFDDADGDGQKDGSRSAVSMMVNPAPNSRDKRQSRSVHLRRRLLRCPRKRRKVPPEEKEKKIRIPIGKEKQKRKYKAKKREKKK